MNEVTVGNCIELMKKLPTKSIDLILTDPPYNAKNIGPQMRVYKEQRMQLPENEYRVFCKDWFGEATRVGKSLLFTPGISNVTLYPQPTWIICWHKPASVSFNRMGGYNAWEPVFFYGKMPKGKRLGQDYLLVNTNNFGKRLDHPCPKPLELMRILVDKFSLEGQTILDPFMGSGTTGVACKELGRRFIGYDIVSDYCEISLTRLSQKQLL